MKKDKGFTLIEILVVVIIIGIILTIGITSALGSSKRLNEKLYNERIDLVLNAAKQFGQASQDLFTGICFQLDEPVSDAKCFNISMQTLVDNNYLKTEDIIDPRDKSSMKDTNIEVQFYYDKVYAVIYTGSGVASGTLLINSGAATTNNRNVTLTLSSTMSNTTDMCISNTGKCTTWIPYNPTYGWTLTEEEGTKTVSAWFRDINKNQSNAIIDTIIFNPTASTASLSINNGSLYTGSRNVSLTINSNTSETGVTSMCISNTGTCTAWEPYTTTKSWTLTDLDGLKTVKVWFRDEEGNQFADATDTIIYETMPPTGTIATSGGIAYTNSRTLNLVLSAMDTGSGMDSMCLSLTTTCSSWVTYNVTASINLSDFDGTQAVSVWYKDKVGNISTRYSTDIHLDRTSPSNGTISINGGADYATNANVTLTLSSTDTTSGIFQMCISQTPTCTSWVTYGTSYNFTLNSGDGLKRVYIIYRDRAGNQSTQISDTITLDTENPTAGTISINSGSDYATSRNVTLTLSSSDTNLSEMCISNTTTCTSFETYATSKTWTLETGDGTKTVYVQYRDAAGRVSTKTSDTIVLDTVNPTCSISFSACAASATGTCTDDTSGVKTGASSSITASSTMSHSCEDKSGRTSSCSLTKTYDACCSGTTTCVGGNKTCPTIGCGCITYGTSSNLQAFCSPSGSEGDQTYITCSVNSWKCRCGASCTSGAESWTATGNRCTTACVNAQPSSSIGCKYITGTENGVNTYKKTVYNCNLVRTCQHPSCGWDSCLTTTTTCKAGYK